MKPTSYDAIHFLSKYLKARRESLPPPEAVRAAFRIWKVEYCDRRGAHLKTLTADGYKQYLDRYWQADEMTMTNHLTGKSTVMIWTDNRYRTDLDERDFTQTGLKRVR